MEKLIEQVEERHYFNVDMSFSIKDNLESYVCIDVKDLDYKHLNAVEMNLEYDQELTDNDNRWKRRNEYEKLNYEYFSFSLKFKGSKISNFRILYDSKNDLIKIFNDRKIHSKHYPNFDKIKELCDGIKGRNFSLILNIDDLLKILIRKEIHKKENQEILYLMNTNNLLKNIASTYFTLLVRTNEALSCCDDLDGKHNLKAVVKSSIEKMFVFYHEANDKEINMNLLLAKDEIVNFNRTPYSDQEYDYMKHEVLIELKNQFELFTTNYSIDQSWERKVHSLNNYSTDKVGTKVTYEANRETLLNTFDLKDNQKKLNFKSESKAPLKRGDEYRIYLWLIAEYNVSNNDMIYNLISKHKNTITDKSDYTIELDSDQVLASVRFYKYFQDLKENKMLINIIYNELLHIP